MSDLRWETISPTLRRVLAGFGRSPLADEFYLASGTPKGYHHPAHFNQKGIIFHAT